MILHIFGDVKHDLAQNTQSILFLLMIHCSCVVFSFTFKPFIKKHIIVCKYDDYSTEYTYLNANSLEDVQLPLQNTVPVLITSIYIPELYYLKITLFVIRFSRLYSIQIYSLFNGCLTDVINYTFSAIQFI